MATSKAATGEDESRSSALTARQFCQALIAWLVALHGIRVIFPKNSEDINAMQEVIAELNKEVTRILESGSYSNDPTWIYRLADLSDSLAPSITGGMDGFEEALRNLQSSATFCPNPRYERIELDLPEAFARDYLATLPVPIREIVEKAGLAFVRARQEVSEETKSG